MNKFLAQLGQEESGQRYLTDFPVKDVKHNCLCLELNNADKALNKKEITQQYLLIVYNCDANIIFHLLYFNELKQLIKNKAQVQIYNVTVFVNNKMVDNIFITIECKRRLLVKYQ